MTQIQSKRGAEFYDSFCYTFQNPKQSGQTVKSQKKGKWTSFLWIYFYGSFAIYDITKLFFKPQKSQEGNFIYYKYF